MSTSTAQRPPRRAAAAATVAAPPRSRHDPVAKLVQRAMVGARRKREEERAEERRLADLARQDRWHVEQRALERRVRQRDAVRDIREGECSVRLRLRAEHAPDREAAACAWAWPPAHRWFSLSSPPDAPPVLPALPPPSPPGTPESPSVAADAAANAPSEADGDPYLPWIQHPWKTHLAHRRMCPLVALAARWTAS